MPTNPKIKLLPNGPYIEIDGGALYLGRDCHLAQSIPALTSKVVSSRHLRITRDDATWYLEDLNSTNGSWLRNERLTKPARLRDGDVFSLGREGPRWRWEAVAGAAPESAGSTLHEAEGPLDAEKTFLLNQTADGSGERPFRVGRTPRVALKHVRTGQEFSVEGYTIVIGRNPGAAQIVIRTNEERHVSGRHAEIAFLPGKPPVLRDLGSSNGTWVNDHPVKGELPLRKGDRVTLVAAATTLVVTALET